MNSQVAGTVLQVVLLTTLTGSAMASRSPRAATVGENVVDPAPSLEPLVIVETDEDSWKLRIAPYLWTAGIDGALTADNIEVDFDVDFDDIWDNLESAGLVFIEARRGRFSVLGDVVYLGLDLDGETPGGADADADVTTTILELAGLYRVTPTSPYEVGLGMRYCSVDTELDVGPISADGDPSAFDGVAVGRAKWPFAQRWNLSLYADVGGGESDLTWQAAAMLGLEFTNWGLGVGYRMLDYDFEEGSDELDLTFEGLMFGAEFRF